MTTFVLDTSAIIRFLDNEAGADRVEEILEMAAGGAGRAIISAANWGEVVGVIIKRATTMTVSQVTEILARHKLEIVPATADRAAKSALIKINHAIPYADAFGVQLAGDSPNHILITADFDAKPAERDIRIEFLPTKP